MENKKTKQGKCVECGIELIISIFASLNTCRCEKCKKGRGIKSKLMSPSVLGKSKPVSNAEPVRIQLYRNRQEIEAKVIMNTGEFFERVPTEYKSRENKLDYLSVSKMDTYTRCPAKFFRQYISDEGIGEDGGNIFTWFGSILHEVVEMANKIYSEQGLKANPIALYDESWKKRQLTDIKFYKDGLELVEDYFLRHPIGSTGKILGMELEWRGHIGGVLFGLVLDHVEEIDSETGLILDYKSNRMPFTAADLENSIQLGIYELVCRRYLFPQYKKWVTGYELFRHGWQQCPERTEEELDQLEQYIINLSYQIENDNVYEEKLNNYCGYCPFNSTCKKYQEFVTNPKRFIESILTDSTDLSALENERELLVTYEKIIKDRKDKVSDVLKMAIENAKALNSSLVIDGQELQLYSMPRQNYNYYETKHLLSCHGKGNLLDQCVTINKTKLDTLIKSDPNLVLELTKCASTSYASPYIVKKKSKAKK